MFEGKRGQVLRTTRVIGFKLEDGTAQKLPTGSRVKFMSKTEKGLRVKIKDKTLDGGWQGVHIDTSFGNVKTVEQGRPEVEAAAPEGEVKATPKAAAKKAGGTGGKKKAEPKAKAKKAGGRKKSAPVVEEAEEMVSMDDEPTDGDLEDPALDELLEEIGA